MGMFARLFGPKEPEVYLPPSEDVTKGLTLLGAVGNFDGLAKMLKSKNPHLRAAIAIPASLAGQSRSLGGGGYRIERSTPMDPRALQLFATMLDDDDERVRGAAENALASHDGDAGVDKLLADHRARKKSG